MKNFVVLMVLVLFAVPVFALDITIEGNTVTIRNGDAVSSIDAANSVIVDHPDKAVIIYAPRKQHLFAEYKFSNSRTLLEAYRETEKHLMEEMKETPSPTDLRGNVDKVEKFLGLDKFNPKDLLITERCYRTCWTYEIWRFRASEWIQLVFEK